MAQQLPPGAEKEQAVTWLSDVSAKDVAAVGNRFDAWLRRISGNHITFEDVKTFAGAVPIVGNIMAMVDALGDIAEIVEKRGGQVLDYMSLAINLLGIIPIPPTLAPFRMSARPLLALVRHELLATRNNLGAAIISVLVTHINATCATEIEDFLNKLKAGLVELLDGCASKAEELMIALATGMDKALHGQLFDANANLKRQQQLAQKMADNRPWYSPSRVGDGIQFAYEGTKALGKKVVNKAAGTAAKLAPDAWLEPFRSTVTFLRTEAPKIAKSIRSLAGSEEGKMMWLVVQLIEAVGRVKARAKLHEQTADVKASGKSQAKKTRGQEGLEKTEGKRRPKGRGRARARRVGSGHRRHRSTSLSVTKRSPTWISTCRAPCRSFGSVRIAPGCRPMTTESWARGGLRRTRRESTSRTVSGSIAMWKGAASSIRHWRPARRTMICPRI